MSKILYFPGPMPHFKYRQAWKTGLFKDLYNDCMQNKH